MSRISFIIVILLTCAALVSYPFIHCAVDDPRDEVSFTENVLYGDVREADGLKVNVRAMMGYGLFWDTACTFGEVPSAETEFTFSNVTNSVLYSNTSRPYTGVEVWLNVNFGTSSSSPIDDRLMNDEPLGKVFIDVASRAPDGEFEEIVPPVRDGLFSSAQVAHVGADDDSYTETIDLSDYFEYYPFEVQFDMPFMRYRWIDRYPDKDTVSDIEQYVNHSGTLLGKAVAEFFKVRVPENDLYDVRIEKNASGGIMAANIAPHEPGNNHNLWSVGTLTDHACVFSFGGDYNVDLPDFSETDGGYGIYALPYARTDDPQLVEIDPKNLRNVYPLDTDVQLQNIRVSEDSKRLMIVTVEDETVFLTVLDAETYAFIDKVEVMPLESGEYMGGTFYEDDFAVFFDAAQRFAVLGYDGDTYRRVLTGDASNVSRILDTTAFEWDGEKLYVVSKLFDYAVYDYDSCGFALSVYSSAGLVYSGEYVSSLDYARARDENERCRLCGVPFVVECAG